MKTTIEIADDLFKRAQSLAREQNTTLRALTEEGLRLVLKEKHGQNWKWKPVVVRGKGLSEDFKDAGWDRIRDEVYRGKGA
jgi:hypothetical protein